MKKKLILYVILLFAIYSCNLNKTESTLQKGNWLFQLHIDTENANKIIPFNVEVLDSHKLIITNAEEKITVSEIVYKSDSVFIKMPVFGSEFKGRINGSSISGDYYNYNKSTISAIPFSGKFGIVQRFEISENATTNLTGNWQASFISENDSSAAIGSFKQNGNYITGTFQTETGDYRYLQGVVSGNKMQLSCFDGAHAFLFTAKQNSNGELEGIFKSGNTWSQKWVAQKTDKPKLADMKTLTFLNPGYERITFSFPNKDGKMISLQDEKYQNKVVLIQIFGTWCPNCMDETKYLVELHKKYMPMGLEIIGLDFEPKTDFDYFKKRIERFRKDLNVPYELLLAGSANKKLAAESLPMLNKVISYPTAIFIDKQGKVREIHTGFSGPGTGDKYLQYKKETEELVKTLLNE
jgi:peroxiredoxin